MARIIILTPIKPPKPASSATPEVKRAYVLAHMQAFVAELEDPSKPMPEYSYAIED
jgi:hypothetical protein